MKRFAAFLALVVVVPLAAWADPPGRVGRVSLVEGEASVFVDPEQGWEGARINSPMTSENSMWTEPGARAEIGFGSTALRLGEATQLDILQLDDEAFRAHVVRGTLAVRIRDFGSNESYAVTTPEARFQLRGNGRYRIDVDPARGESRVTVFAGNARLEAAGGNVGIDTGRSVRVTGGERPRYELQPASSTAFDDWALARDRRFEERESARYVPPEMTGWQDLDDYGVWRSEAEYGAVWFPTRVEAGWAPYRYGRWTWVRPWGWAWVDDAPWGYAPFHYGRWVNVGNRWGWYPGRYTARPVWAPALVGWVGQPGWSISISSAPTNVVGWYPLSPYDRYQPWYRTNVTYVNNVNHIVVPPRRDRDPRRDDRHDNRDRGATVVPRDQFGSHRQVQNVIAPVTREVVSAQPVVSGSSVLPSRNEWRARTKPAELPRTPAAPRAPASGEPVAGRRLASPVAPVPVAPQTKPMAIAPPAPAQPATPSASPPRVVRPAPVEPDAHARPAEPAPRVRPPESAPGARPAEPAPRVRPPESAPGARPAEPVSGARPTEPATSTKPAETATRVKPAETTTRVKPAEPATGARPAEPATRVKPAEPVARERSGEPAAQQPRSSTYARPVPAERPAPTPAQPVAKPAPTQAPPVAKPAPAQEKPAKGADKPAEKPARSGDGG